MKRYLLGTNILLGFSRKAAWAQWAHTTFRLGATDTMAFTSVICRGEILALAEKTGWGAARRRELVLILNRFPTVNIDKEEILKTYACLDAWTHGKTVSSESYPAPPKPAVSMKQNDLWIAATAKATGATLITTDKDFDHLHGRILTREFVDQTSKV